METIRAEARRLRNTVVWSLEGWRAAGASEKTLRQSTLVNVLSAGLAFWLDFSAGERGVILALGLLILAAELMNTGLEERWTTSRAPRIRGRRRPRIAGRPPWR